MVKLRKQKLHVKKKKPPLDEKANTGAGFKLLIKFIIATLVVGFLGLALVRFKYMFVDSEHFLVKGIDVRVSDGSGALRKMPLSENVNSSLLGKNIFFIDLNELKKRIEIEHPEFNYVSVRRALPNRLIVDAGLRKAIAQIRSNRYYLIDREKVILPDVKNFPEPELPIITGIGINIAKIDKFRFTKFEKDKLDEAIELINVMNEISGLTAYKLKMLDVTDPGSVSFYLDGINVEIKIGNTDFENRLKTLTTVIDQLGEDISKFKYIDLRFEDPIIGPG